MDLQQAPVPAILTARVADRDVAYAAIPPNWRGEIIKDPRFEHTPAVVEGKQETADTASFKAYFDRFKNDRTLVTASRRATSVTATLDYHLNATEPAPGRHTLVREYVEDSRFAAWKACNKQQMNQAQFVEFLEDHLADVLSPAQADLLRSIVQFKAFRTANCASAVDLASGDAQFEFTQVTKNAAGQAVLPERIIIRVPVLEFERDWDINARLKYRLNEGALRFWFELIKIDEVEDLAFRTAVDDLSKAILAPVLLAD